MGSMRKIMEQKATKIPGTSSCGKTDEVDKSISKLEFLKFDINYRPNVEENKRINRDSWEKTKDEWVR